MENDENRKTFGEFLKVLFLRNRLKQAAVASHLNISRQRLGLVCAGKTPLPGRLFHLIHDLLRDNGAREKDLNELSRLFVESKVSIPASMLGNPDELFKTATELRDYMDLEKALAKCLDIASQERNFDTIMNELVEIVGTRTGSHFCAIYQYENNYSCARKIYEWHSGTCLFDPERFRKVCQTFKHKTVRQPDLHQCLRVQRVHDHAGDSAAVLFTFPGPHRPEDRYRMSRDRYEVCLRLCREQAF